jgi:hypothetical protein
MMRIPAIPSGSCFLYDGGVLLRIGGSMHQPMSAILLSIARGLTVGCGIDLSDSTEGLSEEELAGEGGESSAHNECRESLAGIQKKMKSAGFSRIPSTGFLTDDSPTKARRNWTKGSSFDTIGWKPKGKIQASYKFMENGVDGFQATCIADVDEDGVMATWTVTESSGPEQTTGAEIR